MLKEPNHPTEIRNLSPSFCKIYNQACLAEENDLDEICGPGYRKALEFLVKDYVIQHEYKNDAGKAEAIKKEFLGSVIQNHIEAPNIKLIVERAVWLGNDETHYVRKWTDKDLQDLKNLIRIAVAYIDMKIVADRYNEEMQKTNPKEGDSTPPA